MANEQNLIPSCDRTPSERREIAQKGGIASGEARRAKKTRRELALQIANTQIKNDTIKQMVKVNTGLEDVDITGDAAVVNGLYTAALQGDVKAYD